MSKALRSFVVSKISAVWLVDFLTCTAGSDTHSDHRHGDANADIDAQRYHRL